MTIAPVAASLPLVDPFIEPQAAEAEAPLAAPMAASLAAPMAATAPTPEQQAILDNGQLVTFTSLGQLALILGLTEAQTSGLSAPLKAMIWRDENNAIWGMFVTEKRQGTGSILNPQANTTTIVPAGVAFAMPHFLPSEGPLAIPGSPEYYGPTPPFTEDQFLAMHSSEQVAAMLIYGVHYNGRVIFEMPWNTQADPADPLQPRRTDQHFTPNLTAILNDAGNRAIIVDQLDSRAIAKLSKAEQESVALHVAFIRKYGPALGLSTDKPTAVDDAIAAVMGYVVPIPTIHLGGHTPGIGWAGAEYISQPLTNFSEEDRAVFVRQLELLKEKLDSQGIWNPKALQTEVAAITGRFETAYAYGSVMQEQTVMMEVKHPHVARRVHSAISLDGGATVKSGFDNFMAQERRILELAESRAQLDVSAPGSRKMDLPTLILKIQLYYNMTTDALVNIKTEEIRQQNDLLKTYAAMQRVVSERSSAAAAFGEASLAAGPYHQGSVEDWEAKQVFTLGSMFHNDIYIHWNTPTNYYISTTAYNKSEHPIEKLKKITRPVTGLFTDTAQNGDHRGQLNRYNASTWASYGTRLSDTVTLINQETQIQMNAISTLEKEKNRYFEMGNNALAKLNEIVQSIARSI